MNFLPVRNNFGEYNGGVELSHIRYFVAAAEELHFGRAARRLHVTQPSLSKRVAGLERELGVRLFHRTRREVRLTEAGEIFLEGARRVLEDALRAAEEARKAGRGELGRLEIGFFSPAIYGVLPEILKEYHERFPEVRVTLHEWTSSVQLERMREGKIEIGFMRAPVEEAGFVTEHVFVEPVVAALPEGHPQARREVVSPRELADEPFIMVPRSKEPNSFDRYVSICQRAGFSPKITQEVFEIHAIVGLVATGMGVAFVQGSVANLKRPGVVYRPLDDPEARIGTAIVRRSSRPSPVLRTFLETLQAFVA